MTTTHVDTAKSLVELGFTALESDIYVLLLGKAPATGHAIARGLGKANANVYKALESLEAKGAVVVGDAEPRIYRPVPTDELLRQIEKAFADRQRRAEAALAGLERRSQDDGIYRMTTSPQVVERARTVVDRSTFALIADGDAPLMTELEPEFEAAAARGVQVLVKSYRPLDLAGVRTIPRPRPEEITADTPGTFAVIASDGREFLLCRLAHSGSVQQAIWTASPMLAFQGYMGLINELTLTSVMGCLESGGSIDDVRRAFERDRPLHPVTSRNTVYRNLLQALGHEASGEADPAEETE